MRLHLETTAKWDAIPDHQRTAPLDELTFLMHLPYLLECSSPFEKPLGAIGRFYSVTFEPGRRSVSYEDGHTVTDTYTLARVRISWSEPRPSLKDLLSRPLVEETVFPVMVVNSIVEAYQLLVGDYSNHELQPLEIIHITGFIRLKGIEDPLTFSIGHRPQKPEVPVDRVSPDRLLESGLGLLSNENPWLARKCFNNARRLVHLKDLHLAIVECVTCIETLSDFVIARIMRAQGAAEADVVRALSTGVSSILRRQIRTFIAPEHQNSVDRWLDGPYRLRNRIVHEGHKSVGSDDAQKCLTLTAELAQRLEDLVRQFPTAVP